MEKLIITAAICGAEVLKEHNPAVPYTVEECVRKHVRPTMPVPVSFTFTFVMMTNATQDKERFRVVMDAITEACPGVILQPSPEVP